MPERWWPIIDYRDFWDVPRAALVQAPSAVLLLDCPFEIELDDYRAEYKVYRVPEPIAVARPDD